MGSAKIDLADGNLAKGRAHAESHYARFQVICAVNKFGGIDFTPSFRGVRGVEDGMERYQTFYTRRPHPAFVRVLDVPKWSNVPAYATEFTVTPEAIDDLLAFVKTIAKLDLLQIPVTNGVGPSG